VLGYRVGGDGSIARWDDKGPLIAIPELTGVVAEKG